MSSTVCGFIGLGLIGGSIARALKAADPSIRIIAFDPNEESLRMAQEEGIADAAVSRIDASFSACAYIFLCAPVEINDENLILLRPFLRPETTLTDIGSVKTDLDASLLHFGDPDGALLAAAQAV